MAIQCKTNAKLDAIALSGTPVRFDEKELNAITCEYRALIVVEQYAGEDKVEAALAEWIKLLLSCDNISAVRTVWFQALKGAASEVTTSLSPGLTGSAIQDSLAQALVVLDRIESSDGRLSDKEQLVRDQITATVGVVTQHKRHLALVGTTLFTEGNIVKLADGRDPGFLLVHIFNPFARNAQGGLQAVNLLGVGKNRVQ